MTRLIDIEDVSLLKTVTCGGLSAKALWRRVNAQPTVDAIPIEYIKKHMNGFYDHGYTEFGSALEALIMDWEEEND